MAQRFEYYDVGDNGYDYVNTNRWLAQTFQPTVTHDITKVRIKAGRTVTTGSFTISVRAVDGAGKPTGGDLTSLIFNSSVFPGGSAGGWADLEFSTPYELQASISYALVLRSNESNLNILVYWRWDTSGEYAGGSTVRYKQPPESAPFGWTVLSGYDNMFEEWGTAPVPPSVSTQGISDLGDQTAIANGTIEDTFENCDKRGFVYSKISQPDPGNVTPVSSGYDSYIEETGSFGVGDFSLTLTGLDELTTYYVRSYAHNSQGYAYGEEKQFSNVPVAYEKLLPNAPGDETNIPDGGTPHWNMCRNVDSSFVYIGVGFGYFTGNLVQVLDIGAGRDLYHMDNPLYRSANVIKVKYRSRTGRTRYPYGDGYRAIKTHGTVYTGTPYGLTYWHSGDEGWFRDLVINSEVCVYYNNPFTGNPWTLAEIDELQAGIWLENEGGWDDPVCDQVHIIVCWANAEVKTNPATGYSGTEARLNGVIIEDEGDTEVLKPRDGILVYFEWGESVAYGNSTIKQSGKVKDDSFSADIGGLDPLKTYHYRAVCETSDGETFYGQDVEITLIASGAFENMASKLVGGGIL